MVFNIQRRPLPGSRCPNRFFYPAEDDGPGTLAILEYRCVLRLGHRGPHQVESLSRR